MEEEQISFFYKDYMEKDADGKPVQNKETLHYNDLSRQNQYFDNLP
jgi:hypothetical protein